MKTKITLFISLSLLVLLGWSNLKAQAPALLKDSVGITTVYGAVGNTLYFKTSVTSILQQLWKTDGTTAGTQMVKDSIYYDIVGLVDLNNSLYFICQSYYNSNAPLALWKSDGTTAGTVIVKTFTGLTGVGFLTVINNICYFRLNNAIWKTDGTSAGTVEVKAGVVAGTAFYNTTNGIVFFGSPLGTNYMALWKTDGTSAGTTKIKDSVANPSLGNVVSELVNANGNLFYTISSGAGTYLWRTNGTTAGTLSLTYGTISSLTDLNGVLYFRNFSTSPVGYALMKSDGTVSGTTAVSGLGNSGLNISAMGNYLYLGGKSDFNFEPYKSDGTVAGTVLLKDINPGTTGSNPQYFTKVNNTMCFVANDGINGNQIWKTDGTSAGTVMAYAVADTISSNEAPVVRIPFNNYFIFIHRNGNTGDLYSLLVSSGSGINDVISNENEINIYPNPSSGIFKIEFRNFKDASLTVFNLLGTAVWHQKISNEIDISSLPKGVYFIKIQKGENIYTKKIVLN